MVRLKEKWGVYYERNALFQFQDGAVKSGDVVYFSEGKILFQFQDGAVKSKILRAHMIASSVFQFQDGAVKSAPRGFRVGLRRFISIPRWCG